MQEVTFEVARDWLLNVLEGVDSDIQLKALGTVLAIKMAEGDVGTATMTFGPARLTATLENLRG